MAVSMVGSTARKNMVGSTVGSTARRNTVGNMVGSTARKIQQEIWKYCKKKYSRKYGR